MLADRSTRRRFLAGTAGAALLTNSGPAFAQTQTKTYKLAHPETKEHPTQHVAERFAAEVAQKSNGRIKIEVYPAGTLGTVNVVQGLQTGTLEFAMESSTLLESFVPSIQVLNLPFIFKDNAAAEKAIDHEAGRELADEMLSKNLVHLAWGHYGWRHVQTVEREVTSPADLNGLKIQTPAGSVFAATFKALGAIPIVVNGDVYTALQQKTVGGVEVPFPTYVTNKYFEVAKFFAKTNHVYNAGTLIVGRPAFDEFSRGDMRLIRDAASNQTAFWRSTIAQAEAEYERQTAARGVKITNTDFKAFRTAMAPVYAEFKPKYPSLFNRVAPAVT